VQPINREILNYSPTPLLYQPLLLYYWYINKERLSQNNDRFSRKMHASQILCDTARIITLSAMLAFHLMHDNIW